MNSFLVGPARRCRFEQLELRRLLAGDLLTADLDAPAASLGGRVQLTAAESCAAAQHTTGIANVTLRLLNEQGLTVQSASTNDSGRYSFTALTPGIYAVLQEQPAGLTDAGLHIGTGGGQFLAQNLVGEIEVTAGASLTGYDFCESTAANSQNEGPPQLDRQSGNRETFAASNVFLQSPTIQSQVIGYQGSLPTPENSSSGRDRKAQQASDEQFFSRSALTSEFGDIATRRRGDTSRSTFSAEGLGSAFDRVREAIVDELFDRVSWNATNLRDAMVQPLSWLVPDRSENGAEQSEAVETAETAAPAIKVAKATEPEREQGTEVR